MTEGAQQSFDLTDYRNSSISDGTSSSAGIPPEEIQIRLRDQGITSSNDAIRVFMARSRGMESASCAASLGSCRSNLFTKEAALRNHKKLFEDRESDRAVQAVQQLLLRWTKLDDIWLAD